MNFENMYGSGRRLEWILTNVGPSQRIAEFGCGTGQGILRFLLLEGLDATGYDLDSASIEAGKAWFIEQGLDPARLQCMDLRQATQATNAIIASEVLEHMNDAQVVQALDHIHQVLEPGGLFLATVPNGRGWFEIESRVAKWTGAAWMVQMLRLHKPIDWLRRRVLGEAYIQWHWTPTSLDESPHLQKFSLNSFQERLEEAGFHVVSATGTSFACGPLTQTFFAGIRPIMKINNWLAQKFPRRASGFMVVCRKGGN